MATGYNVVDLDAARDAGVIVSNVPAYSTPDVAQMTFALLLELCLHVGEHSNLVMEGDWTRAKDFSFWNTPLVELAGKTGTAEIKDTVEDTSGTELGWMAVYTTDPDTEKPLLLLTMVQDVKERGGSGYVVDNLRPVLESYLLGQEYTKPSQDEPE